MKTFKVDEVEYYISKDDGRLCVLRTDSQEVANQKEVVRRALAQRGYVVEIDDKRNLYQLIRRLSKFLENEEFNPEDKKLCMTKLNEFIYDLDCLNALYKYTSEANIFDILKINSFEIRHSNMLAWLLNPNENHGLQDKLLKKILMSAIKNASVASMSDVKPIDIELMNLSDSVVYREKDDIDILVVSDANKFVVAIENKTKTKEHDNQLGRYLQTIKTEFPEDYKHVLIYLTPEGELSSDPENWIEMDYDFIKDALESLIQNYDLPEKSKMYIKDYILSIRRHIVEDKELKDICNKIYFKHKAALDLIFENKPDLRGEISDYIKEYLISKQEECNITVWNYGKDCTKKFTRFIPNELESFCRDKGEGWVTKNYILGFEVENPEVGNLIIKITIGPSKPEFSEYRQKFLDVAMNNSKKFRCKDYKLKNEWKTIDTFTLVKSVENLSETGGDFDELIGKRLDNYLKNEMPEKVKLLLKAIEG